MNTCTDRRETLLLDVHGELPSGERPAWERHLETCAGCRQERRELARLLEVARKSMTTPALTPAKAKQLRDSITGSWMAERPTRWWQGVLVGVRLRPIPAMITASLLLLALGWFGLRGFQARSPNGPNPETRERIVVSDLEVIENLDLLEEMEDIGRVVQVVDDRDILL